MNAEWTKGLKSCLKWFYYRAWESLVPAPAPFSFKMILPHLLQMWIILPTRLTWVVQTVIKTVLFFSCNNILELSPSPALTNHDNRQFSLMKEKEKLSIRMPKLRKVQYQSLWYLHTSANGKNQDAEHKYKWNLSGASQTWICMHIIWGILLKCRYWFSRSRNLHF